MDDPPGFKSCTRGDGFSYPPGDALRSLSIHHRSNVGRGVEWVTDPQRGDLRTEKADEFLKARRLDVHALHRDAALS